MAKSLEELIVPMTELPLVRLDTIDLVTNILIPGEYYYEETLEQMSVTNKKLYNFLREYSRHTGWPNETKHTVLLSYSLLEEEEQAPKVSRKAAMRVRDEIKELGMPEFTSLVKGQMQRKNIFYYNALDSYISDSHDSETNWNTAALFYRLFEKQAEVNRLKIN